MLEGLKEFIKDTDIKMNPWFSDMYLLRFCRARKFVLNDVIKMFDNFIKWREENNVDTILQDFQFTEEAAVVKAYPRAYFGCDKQGRPLYVERNGKIDLPALFEAIPLEKMWR